MSGSSRRSAFIAASRAKAARSAPTYPWVTSTKCSRSKSSARGMVRVWIWRISRRPSLSGTPISISRSKRPGLLRAGSTSSTRLVAAITMTLPRPWSPSISVSSWATTRRSSSWVPSPRLGAMESISSMKTMAGAFSSASSKILRSWSSDSP